MSTLVSKSNIENILNDVGVDLLKIQEKLKKSTKKRSKAKYKIKDDSLASLNIITNTEARTINISNKTNEVYPDSTEDLKIWKQRESDLTNKISYNKNHRSYF